MGENETLPGAPTAVGNIENPHQSNESRMSYANTIANSKLPRKGQAIIIESLEGLTLEDYIDGLEELTDVNNVLAISKVSGSRVCIYLSKKDQVTQLKNKTVNIKEYALEIKPLVPSSNRHTEEVQHKLTPQNLPNSKRPRSSTSGSVLADHSIDKEDDIQLASTSNNISIDVPIDKPAENEVLKTSKKRRTGNPLSQTEKERRVEEALSSAIDALKSQISPAIDYAEFVEFLYRIGWGNLDGKCNRNLQCRYRFINSKSPIFDIVFEMEANDSKIMFGNARSISRREEELPTMLSGINILVCVESWLKDGKTINIPGYVPVQKDREDTDGGGIIFLLKSSLDFHILDIPNHPDGKFEICGIRINNVHSRLNVIACYRPPADIVAERLG
ncbi:hypothetical protein QAD02_004115 [Eretmocerus hayati]|uniref:Uncharacterized protein n=2 Tax=Eretmocerus hayati TaxID=131215 RepID=A0ACC2NTH9_9HYME|nr:hypothetical protein QAD02_004113 [Eretmocerus hayati]KAJ8672855.1 hypothetical protein QAD02_004115 [Eretmocerus hayati]